MLGILFFIPAMNLAGIPPLSGFVGKIGLLQAGAEHGGFLAYLLIGGGVVTSLLTLYAMAKVWNRAFWRPVAGRAGEAAQGAGRCRGRWSSPPPCWSLVGVGITAVAGPLYGFTERAADRPDRRQAYVTAVLPEGVR